MFLKFGKNRKITENAANLQGKGDKLVILHGKKPPQDATNNIEPRLFIVLLHCCVNTHEIIHVYI